MLPQNHFLFGLIASVILYFVFDVGILSAAVFLLASILIDVDHYLYYAYRKRDWSLVNAVGWFLERGRILKKAGTRRKNEFYTAFCFLHGVEALILLGALGYFIWDIFYFVLLGFAFHLILDYAKEVRRGNRFDKFSVVYDYFKYKKLKHVDKFEEGVENRKFISGD